MFIILNLHPIFGPKNHIIGSGCPCPRDISMSGLRSSSSRRLSACHDRRGDGHDANGTKSWMNFSPWFKNLSLFLLRCFFLKALRFQTVSWNLALFNGRGRLRWEPGCPPQGVHPSKSGWIILERSTMLLMGKSTILSCHFATYFQ